MARKRRTPGAGGGSQSTEESGGGLLPSLDEEAAASERRATREDEPSPEQLAGDVGRTLTQLIAVLRSPWFAYAIAAVLAVPAGLWLFAAQPPAAAGGDPTAAAPSSPEKKPIELPRAPVEPRGRALLALERYADALRLRDIGKLREHWRMSHDQEKAVEAMFRDARIIAPLVDLQLVEKRGDEQLEIVFAQVLTLVRGEGQFFARGPVVFRAQVIRGPGFDSWILTDREEIASPENAVARESGS